MKKVILILLFALIIIAILPIFLPKTMHLEQEYIYDEPIEKLFQNFNDLKKFTSFNKWTIKDSDINYYSKPYIGINAKYSWKDKDQSTGEGYVEITDVSENEFINYKLKFDKYSENTAEIIFQKLDDDKTKVIWSFDTEEAKYPFQIFNILMKKSVKKDINNSLINLDSLLTKNKLSTYKNTDLNIIENKTQKLFGILQQTSSSSDEISTAIDESFGKIYSYLKDIIGKSPEQIGYPIVFWKNYSKDNDNALFYCGYIVENTIDTDDEFEYTELPKGKSLSIKFVGNYKYLESAYNSLEQYSKNNEIILSNESWNIYLNKSQKIEDKTNIIQINVPIIE